MRNHVNTMLCHHCAIRAAVDTRYGAFSHYDDALIIISSLLYLI